MTNPSTEASVDSSRAPAAPSGHWRGHSGHSPAFSSTPLLHGGHFILSSDRKEYNQHQGPQHLYQYCQSAPRHCHQEKCFQHWRLLTGAAAEGW